MRAVHIVSNISKLLSGSDLFLIYLFDISTIILICCFEIFIKTTLILFENGRFALDETYIGRDASFTQVGTYTRQGDIITLQSEEDAPRYYQLGSDTATLLDQDKKPVQGELAPYYTLKKVNE